MFGMHIVGFAVSIWLSAHAVEHTGSIKVLGCTSKLTISDERLIWQVLELGFQRSWLAQLLECMQTPGNEHLRMKSCNVLGSLFDAYDIGAILSKGDFLTDHICF